MRHGRCAGTRYKDDREGYVTPVIGLGEVMT